MRLLSIAVVLCAATAQAADVTLLPGEKSVRILIGDEVFAVYNRGEGYKKPFLYPVAVPGALDRLGPESDSRVIVVAEQPELKTSEDTPAPEFGAVIEIDKVERPWLRIAGQEAWIHQRDIVPVIGMVTRVLQMEASQDYDHVHHKGVWLSIDEVNDIKFWAERGTIRNVGVEVVKESGTPAVFQVTNHWLGNDDQPIVNETTTVSVYPNGLMVYDIEFQAAGQSVTFDDTKEGLFGIRLPNEMRESTSGAPVVGSNGVVGTKQLWGTTLPWIDYTGPVGGVLYGVALMDHPDNFRPSRYHVRDYGLFSISPFGESAYTSGSNPPQPLTLQPGESVRLRYGLYVHSGDTRTAHVAAVFDQFVDAAR